GDASIGVSQSGGGLTLSGTISGPFGITKVGAGNLVLNGSNTFTGGVAINAGQIVVGNSNALNGRAVTFGAASSFGTLTLNGFNVTISGLNTNATPGTTFIQNISATPATLTVNGGGTFAG